MERNGNPRQKLIIAGFVLCTVAAASITCVYLPSLAVSRKDSQISPPREFNGGGSMWKRMDHHIKGPDATNKESSK
jgi:hypothetical protein